MSEYESRKQSLAEQQAKYKLSDTPDTNRESLWNANERLDLTDMSMNLMTDDPDSIHKKKKHMKWDA